MLLDPKMGQRERPHLRHGLALGTVAAGIALLLLSPVTWDLTARAAATILTSGGVGVTYISSPTNPSITLRLLDQTIAVFYVLIECAGLITVAVYSLLTSGTLGLLRAPFRFKLSWLLLGIGVGLTWNILRVVVVITTTYNFGMSAFTLSHYVIGPIVDFLWVVMVWSLGMSMLTKRRGETA